MARLHDWQKLGREMEAEMRGDAKAIGKELFSSALPDTEKLSGLQFTEYFRRNWNTGGTGWRMAALKQYGADSFVKMAKDAFKPGREATSGPE